MLSGVWQILTTQDTQDSLGQLALLNFVKLALIEFARLEKRLDSAFTRVCNVQQGWEAPAVQWSLGVFFVQSSDLLHWHASSCIHPEIIGAKHIYTHSAASCNRKCQARKRKKTSDIGFLCSIHLTLPPMASIRSISSRTSYDPTQGLAASTSTLMALPVTKAGQLSVKIRQDSSSYQTCPGWMAWGAGLGVEFGG